jgi:ABC-type oligopeptide transport system ATPase subunit
VQVRYRPGGPLALDGLDLDLPPRRRVALAGRSGAGKSTVAAVLLRFCDPVGGTVTLGGAALGSCAADDVRAVIGGCLQDPHRQPVPAAVPVADRARRPVSHSPARDDDTGTRAQQTASMAAAR